MKTFAEVGIVIPPGRTGNVKTICPQCSATRKKSGEPCLSVEVGKGVWQCKHCGWSGSLAARERWQPVEVMTRPISEQGLAWFAGRGISREIVERNRIEIATRNFGGFGNLICAAFPYVADGVLVNVKFRSLTGKLWQQSTGGESVPYKLADIRGAKEAIICEGEIDALSFEAAGYRNCVSVPGGAINPNDTSTAGKLKFLDTCADAFAPLETICLATDNDAPGLRLREELARRLGKERCLVVSYPAGCKDANDVLLRHGALILAECVKHAEPFPIEGIIHPATLTESLVRRRYETDRLHGVKLGLPPLDALFSWRAPAITVITGSPHSGKTPFATQCAMTLAARHGWRWGIFTPEHLPLETDMQRLASQIIGKPYPAAYSGAMTDAELRHAAEFISEHVRYIAPADGALTWDDLLRQAEYLVKRHGIRGLIIDPWQYIEAQRKKDETETRFTGRCLRKARRFVSLFDVHLIIIAHPRQMQRVYKTNEYPVPGGYDISGSAAWYDIPDNGLTVYRRRDENDQDECNEIHIWKCKSSYVGETGMASLHFDRDSERFFEGYASGSMIDAWRSSETTTEPDEAFYLQQEREAF